MEQGALRQQIAQATAEKEQTKLKFEALKRTIDGHIFRLNSVLDGPDVNFDRLAATIQAMDVELRSGLAPMSSAPAADGAYEVLRSSLSETQRRCQDLNSEMLRVAEANEDLHNTLRSLKATNRRLVEEVQKQTEELSSLTQQRLADMEKLSRQEEMFSREKAVWTQEAQKTLEEEQRRLDEDFCAMKDGLTGRLDSCWRKAAACGARAENLRAGQRSLKSEVQSAAHSFSQGLKSMERELLDRIAEEDKKMRTELSRLQDAEHKLQVKLKAERELRTGEAESWRSRQAALASELEALIGRRDAEVAELQSKVELAMTQREAEEAAAKSERRSLQDKVEASAKELALQEAELQSSRRQSNQTEGRLSLAQSERDRLQALVDNLRQQVKGSDEALADAIKSNEALREQMELQRLDAQTACERDLKLWRDKFQQHLEDQEEQHRVEQAEVARRIKALEEVLGSKAGKIQALREALAEKSKARESLGRDVKMWKAQYELAARMKGDVEKDVAHFKEEFLGRRMREKQEEYDALRRKQADLEARKTQLGEEAQKLEREIQAQEAQDAARAMGVADLRREVVAEAERTKANLTEVESTLRASKAEAAVAQQQLAERKDRLEQELQRVSAECDAERRELERKIQAERASCESLRKAAERMRQDQQDAYQAALQGPAQELASLEGSIQEIQHSADLELSSLRQKSEKLRARSEELEAELLRLQAKVEKTDKEVQDGTGHLNTLKARNRNSLEALQKEKVRKNEELQKVQGSITQKIEQLRRLQPTEALMRGTGSAIEDRQARSPSLPRYSPPRDVDLSRTRYSPPRDVSDLSRCLSEQRNRTRHLQDLSGRMRSMEDRTFRQSFG